MRRLEGRAGWSEWEVATTLEKSDGQAVLLLFVAM